MKYFGTPRWNKRRREAEQAILMFTEAPLGVVREVEIQDLSGRLSPVIPLMSRVMCKVKRISG